MMRVHDTCANGQKQKMLTVVDDWTRECLTIEVEGGLHGGRVIEVLERVIRARGAPCHLRSDQGPGCIAREVKRWLAAQGVGTASMDPGKPWQNGTNESFNGRFRDGWLNVSWCADREEARVRISTWRREYNEVRAHSSVG
jgi:putative transposase